MADNKDRLTAEEAERKIREIIKLGDINLSYHCFSESMPFRKYDSLDVESVLSKGQVVQPPEYDTKYRNWKCKIEGKLADGEIVIVIAAFISHRELKCITIMPK